MQESQDFDHAEPSKLTRTQKLASYIVDALMDGGLIKEEQLELAVEIVEEELNVWDLGNDVPVGGI